MRAVFLENIDFSEEKIVDDKFHHLMNVVRVKKFDKILLLNGKGSSRQAEIVDISKKYILIKTLSAINEHLPSKLKVALGIPKKDALDLCLKQIVELGIKDIYLLQSEYSQKFAQANERFKRIFISSMEQSNNPWLPEVKVFDSVQKLETINVENIVYFSSQKISKTSKESLSSDTLLVIGPEGGFSLEEEAILEKLNTIKIHIEGSIMRTPTALAFGAGFVQGLMDKNIC